MYGIWVEAPWHHLSEKAAFLVVTAPPLDFAGTLKVLRTKFVSEELLGIEASRISFGLLQRLRSAFCCCCLVQEDATWYKLGPFAGFGCCEGTWLTTLVRSKGCTVRSIRLAVGVLGMVLTVCLLRALWQLVTFGTLRPGLVRLCLPLS